jgi:hypothetical protein
MLQKNGLLEIVDDVNTTNPVIVAVTFDGGKISRFFSHVTGGFKQVVRPYCSQFPVMKMCKVMCTAFH